MKRILIIGKNSYIGQAFFNYMKTVHEEAAWEIDLVGASDGAWNEVSFESYDCILHLAAIVHRREKELGEELYRKVNYQLPLLVAQKAKEAGVRQFVFMSSMAVYGRTGRITEHTELKPVTYYGRYKKEAEQGLLLLEEESFRVVVLRPPMIYGRGCAGNFPRLVKLAGYLPLVPDISNRRSMLHIEELCEYLFWIIKEEKHGTGHPQSKEYVSTSRMMEAIRSTLHKKTRRTVVFNPLIAVLKNRCTALHKMFGDCYYEMEEDLIPPQSYQRLRLLESIEKSL